MQLIEDLAIAARQWRFWMFDAWLDLAVRHRNALLGFAWFFVPNLITIVVIGGIFRHVFGQDQSFFLYITLGVVFWLPINQVCTVAPELYKAKRAFILVGGTPLLAFNMQLVFNALMNFAIQCILIVGALAVFRPSLTMSALLAVPAILLMVMTLFPCSIIFALAGARLDDLGEAVRAIMRLLFIATPVFWSVSNGARYELLKPFLYLNPFYFGIELFRRPLMGMTAPVEFWAWLTGYCVVAWIVAAICYRAMRNDTALWL
jgi:ABC-type polysaccharide/polyol phosphate export permease